VLTQQGSPYGLALRESGNPFRIRWDLQEFRETIDAIQQGTNRHQAIVFAPQMGGRAGPRPIGRARRPLGVDGIQSHVWTAAIKSDSSIATQPNRP